MDLNGDYDDGIRRRPWEEPSRRIIPFQNLMSRPCPDEPFMARVDWKTRRLLDPMTLDRYDANFEDGAGI